jgi:hypothetical protein
MLSSRSPERISDTTRRLPIYGSSDCVRPCASMSDLKPSCPVDSRIWAWTFRGSREELTRVKSSVEEPPILRPNFHAESL